MARHAEIAGGGIAGLAVGTALARRGWSVRIHERAGELRGFGAGIYIWENGLKVLEALGAYDMATRTAIRGFRRDSRDQRNRLFRRTDLSGFRLYTVLRQDLLDALAAAARDAGCAIELDSAADAADPNGRLRVNGEWTAPADLVIAADGVNSAVRDSLDLVRRRRLIDQFAIRTLIRREAGETADDFKRSHCEYWSGEKRLLYAPCTADWAYVQLTSLVGDPRGNRIPIDRAYWRDAFPHCDWIVERLPEDGRGDQFQMVKLRQWSRGRVAVLGDAAHAQTPNLGQGGGCSLMTALSLAVTLETEPDVPAALARWEPAQRPIVDLTQDVAYWYGQLAFLPQVLRHRLFRLIDGSDWLKRRTILATALHVPIGTA
jgi:2-polyprenyl-6-methoxyphenol hydroxylase-like FAD-dependent oxidoreductase